MAGTWKDNYSVYEDGGSYYISEDPYDDLNTDIGWLYPQASWSSPIQQINNPGGVLAPAALGMFAAGGYVGDKFANGEIAQPVDSAVSWAADKLTPNVSTVAKTGPMRFAGRGVAPKGEIVQTETGLPPYAEAVEVKTPLNGTYVPSHEIPGYDRMINEHYDSWAPEPQESWRPDLAGTTDYSQWTEDNPVNIHYNSQGEPVEMYGWEGGIADISMLDYGIDVPGGMGLTPNANRTVFNSPYPGELNEATIVREEVDNRNDWQKWKDSLKQGWETK